MACPIYTEETDDVPIQLRHPITRTTDIDDRRPIQSSLTLRLLRRNLYYDLTSVWNNKRMTNPARCWTRARSDRSDWHVDCVGRPFVRTSSSERTSLVDETGPTRRRRDRTSPRTSSSSRRHACEASTTTYGEVQVEEREGNGDDQFADRLVKSTGDVDWMLEAVHAIGGEDNGRYHKEGRTRQDHCCQLLVEPSANDWYSQSHDATNVPIGHDGERTGNRHRQYAGEYEIVHVRRVDGERIAVGGTAGVGPNFGEDHLENAMDDPHGSGCERETMCERQGAQPSPARVVLGREVLIDGSETDDVEGEQRASGEDGLP